MNDPRSEVALSRAKYMVFSTPLSKRAYPSDDSSPAVDENGLMGGIDSMEQVLPLAQEKLNELYRIHDHFFTANKTEKQAKLQTLVDEILDLLSEFDYVNVPLNEKHAFFTPNDDDNNLKHEETSDTNQPITKSYEKKKFQHTRNMGNSWNENLITAQVNYIRGKALDVFSEYNAQSEEYLVKSVKLHPTNLDTWVSLGNCYWKKGDLVSAKNCFVSCMDYGSSKKALRYLSMVLRQMGVTPEEKSINIQTSLQKAKQALTLDLQDGESWYVLGNAYLALFFCNSHSPSDLDKAFSAYKQAEMTGAESNPDLYFNRANVCRYKEDYSEALESYRKAYALDPSLPALEAIDSIVRRVNRVDDLIQKKCRIKVKRLESLVSSLLQSENTIQGRQRVPVSSLRYGANEGKVVALKSLVDVARTNEPPGCFVMVDEENKCVAVAIYHLDSNVYAKMTDKDVFYVLDPFLKKIELTGHGKTIRYQCLQVAEPHLFLINGKVMADSYAHAEVKLANFDL